VRDAFTNTNAYGNSYAYGDSYSYSNSDRYSNTNGDSNANTEASSQPAAEPNTTAAPVNKVRLLNAGTRESLREFLQGAISLLPKFRMQCFGVRQFPGAFQAEADLKEKLTSGGTVAAATPQRVGMNPRKLSGLILALSAAHRSAIYAFSSAKGAGQSPPVRHRSAHRTDSSAGETDSPWRTWGIARRAKAMRGLVFSGTLNCLPANNAN